MRLLIDPTSAFADGREAASRRVVKACVSIGCGGVGGMSSMVVAIASASEGGVGCCGGGLECGPVDGAEEDEELGGWEGGGYASPEDDDGAGLASLLGVSFGAGLEVSLSCSTFAFGPRMGS